MRPEKRNDTRGEEGAPKTFGPYEILAELGRGGMGVVYKARHPALDRIVALKVLIAGQMASATQMKRFQREAELAGKLKHPSIVQIHDVGQIGNYQYFTMDYIEGSPLSEKVKRRDVPVRQAIEIARDMALALAHAHAQGVIHRDVKPANIIIDKAGAPFITDFGLAKEFLDTQSKLTRTGAAVGTPFYMSPEQSQGNVEPASDVYSLGVVLFEMLTFELPFTAKTQIELTRKILFEEPPRPTSFEPAIDADVETIVLKTLRKEPSERYTAEELAQDLKRYLAGEAIRARPRTAAERFRAKLKRNWAAVLTVAIAVPTVVAVTIGAVFYFQMRGELEEAQRNGVLVQAQKDKEAREKAEREAAALESARLRGQALKEAEHAWTDVDRIPLTATDAFKDKIRATVKSATEALRHDPKCARAFLLRGRAQEVSQALDDALRDYSQAREVEPDGPTGGEAAFREGRLRHRRHDYKKSLPIFEELSKRNGTGIWRILAKASVLVLATEKPRHEAALAEVEAALRLDPTCADAYFMKAVILGDDKNKLPSKEEMDCLNAALEADRKNAKAYAVRAQARQALGQDGPAEEDLAHALALDPDEEVALITRANMRAGEDRFAEALQDLARVLKMQEPHEDREILLHVASLAALNGQIEAAQRYADRAAELSPGKPEPFLAMERIYLKHGQVEAAIRELKRGLEACSKDEKTYDEIGLRYTAALAQTVRFDEALAFVEKEIKAAPGSPGRKFWLAELYAGRRESRQDIDRALGIFEEIHQQSPAYVEAYRAHFTILKALGRLDECGALADRLYRAAPRDIDALVAVSTTHHLRGRVGDAFAVAKRALEIDPRSAPANAQLAFLEYQRDDLEAATRYAKTALEQDADNTEALTVLGAVTGKEHKFAEAEGYCRRAIKAEPRNDNAVSIYIMVLLQQQKLEAAAREGERFLRRIPPEEAPARVTKALAYVYLGQKRDREAETLLAHTVAEEPGDPTAHEAYADALYRVGKTEKALEEANTALKIDPSSEIAQKIKAAIEGR
ncbi:protein kinase [bacterium]|nr:protein kinase [bacterium]